MGKRFMQLAAVILLFCMAAPTAGAVTTNQNGDIMLRVGLASASGHVPTGELEAAHLTNNTNYGSGYRFGYYDKNLNFVELARTKAGEDDVAVLKTVNLRYGNVSGKNTYSSSLKSGPLVGWYHVQISGSFKSYDEASKKAASYQDGFVAWIDGAYQVRVGSYATEAEAKTAADGISGADGAVGTSAYGLSVVATGTNRILFQFDDGAGGKLAIQPDVTGVEETRTWFSQYKYRGGFQYHRRNGGNVTVVNVLPLEDYINGVVCFEMGRNWPLEALKAQALCARTYVLKYLGKHNSYGFDICPSASCQAYYGMGDKTDNGPSEISMRAVAETAGMVIRYNGKLIEAVYSSSFGGASEDAKYVWGTDTETEHPYLRGVVDPYEAASNNINSRSSWTVRYTAAELTKKLQSGGLGTGTTVDHLVLTYSDKGNVIQVVVHWANGQSNTISAGNIRGKFGVNSIHFTVNGTGTESMPAAPTTPAAGGELYVNGAKITGGTEGMYVISGSGTVSPIDGTPYVITGGGTVSKAEVPKTDGNSGDSGASVRPGSGTVTVSGDSYIFNGGGWGHQLGMSQYGAYAMANRGFKYDEILKFYLPGVQIETY